MSAALPSSNERVSNRDARSRRNATTAVIEGGGGRSQTLAVSRMSADRELCSNPRAVSSRMNIDGEIGVVGGQKTVRPGFAEEIG